MLLILLGISLGLVLLLLAINRVPLSYTVRNLELRWLTTLMTALAFTAVVGLMVVMLAFTTGMQRMMEGSAQPGNVVILAEGAIDEAFSNLNTSDLGEIEQLPGVRHDADSGKPWASRETYMIVNQPVVHPQPGRPNGRFLQVRGITDAAMAAKIHNIQLQAGAWFSEAGVEEQAGADSKAPAIQAVLGEGVAGELAADRTAEEARGRQESPPARRGRSLPPGRKGLCRHRDFEIVRRHLQFRNLGQPLTRRSGVRQGKRHDARVGHRECRGGGQAPRLPQAEL